MLKFNIIIAMLALTLSAPAFSETQSDIPTQIRLTPLQDEEVVDSQSNKIDDDNKIDEDTTPNIDNTEQNNTLSPYKEPTNVKKIIKKFLLAMFAVLVSSFAIFVGLSIYNRIRDGFKSKPLLNKSKESDLEKPEDLDSAIKTFMNKTSWD